MSARERMGDLVAGDVHDTTAGERAESGTRLSGKQMFDSMSEAEQNETFGPTIAAALREGKITLADLVKRQPMSNEPDYIAPATADELGLNPEG